MPALQSFSARPWSAGSSTTPSTLGGPTPRASPPHHHHHAPKKTATVRKPTAPYKSLFLQEAQRRAIERSAQALHRLQQSRWHATNEWDKEEPGNAGGEAAPPPPPRSTTTRRPAAQAVSLSSKSGVGSRVPPPPQLPTTLSGGWIRHSSTQTGSPQGGEMGVPLRQKALPPQGPCTSRALSPIDQTIVARVLNEAAAAAARGSQKPSATVDEVMPAGVPAASPKKGGQQIRLRYYYTDPMPPRSPTARQLDDCVGNADTESLVSAFSQGFRSLCCDHCDLGSSSSSSLSFSTATPLPLRPGHGRRRLDMSLSPRQQAEVQHYREQQQAHRAERGGDLHEVASRCVAVAFVCVPACDIDSSPPPIYTEWQMTLRTSWSTRRGMSSRGCCRTTRKMYVRGCEGEREQKHSERGRVI